jgi:hypothetical protein
MKRWLLLIVVLIGLSVLAYYLVQKSEASQKGIVTADRGFTVEKIEDVKKIVIRHVKLQPMVFTREGKNWTLDGKYEVDPAVFVNIEKVLLNMRLEYIPPAASTKNILESIKRNGIQVDLYDGGDQPFKMFHIGSDVLKGSGTYMVMAGSSQPYVMSLPGLEGGLRSRFEQPAKNYRDKFIYKFPAEQIQSIQVEYPMDNFSSFIIENRGKTYHITSLLDLVKKPSNSVNPRVMNSFMNQFEMMGTEGVVADTPEKDSILNMTPVCKLTFKLKNNKTVIHDIYPYDDIVEDTGNTTRSQQELILLNRVFIYNNDDKSLYTAQNRVVRGMFLGYLDFYKGGDDFKQ